MPSEAACGSWRRCRARSFAGRSFLSRPGWKRCWSMRRRMRGCSRHSAYGWNPKGRRGGSSTSMCWMRTEKSSPARRDEPALSAAARSASVPAAAHMGWRPLPRAPEQFWRRLRRRRWGKWRKMRFWPRCILRRSPALWTRPTTVRTGIWMCRFLNAAPMRCGRALKNLSGSGFKAHHPPRFSRRESGRSRRCSPPPAASTPTRARSIPARCCCTPPGGSFPAKKKGTSVSLPRRPPPRSRPRPVRTAQPCALNAAAFARKRFPAIQRRRLSCGSCGSPGRWTRCCSPCRGWMIPRSGTGVVRRAHSLCAAARRISSLRLHRNGRRGHAGWTWS